MGNYEIRYESVGVCLLKDSTLMGIFTLSPLNLISIIIIFVSMDPWILPTPNQIVSFGDAMPLSPLDQNYQEIVLALMVTSESHIIFSMNLDIYVPSPWLGYWDSLDPLNKTFTTEESIVEVMSLENTPWNDLHHFSSFIPSLDDMPSYLEAFVSHFPTPPLQTAILVH